ncbi:MAG: cryptochrome/photolyase family protein [Actinomycetota bacterium]|nr:cryptochrome/photolyase family protein [Actinomycetota bacterium]MDA2972754.1 cryptochrome/photolyase family protein [Actinomycetota bacterium]MDA3000291.1 cryptochrome/photolyase family protein [Actinomycetota bacterium]
METVWVLGDQLGRSLGALRDATPDTHRILIVESVAKLASKNWHVQRAHFVVSSMRHFAEELRAEGFDVDYRRSTSLRRGFHDHVAEFSPASISVTEPASFHGLQMVRELGCTVVRSDQFLCHYEVFGDWASSRKSFKMEDFYRWQRTRLGYLMETTADGEGPVGGRWNFDAENRQPPPKDGVNHWPTPPIDDMDDIDLAVVDDVASHCHGATPTGLWATSRAGALRRLHHFVESILPNFGPHEDAMTTGSWHLAHSLLSPYLNIGRLSPKEVCDAVQAAFDDGRVPIESAEGFIRQVIGWREYVWGLYWRWMPEYATGNALDARRPLPPVFSDPTKTRMRCVASTLGDVHERAYAHHIQRLMIIGNLSLIAGIDPQELTDWMWENFVDGAEWVMVPNVIGMSQYADGGRMATKPYASGGAYIDKMSDYCKGCHFDRKKRVGDDACPFTTLYWDFMARHESTFGRNPRVAQQVRAAFKLSDLDEVRTRATEVLDALDRGDL